MKKINYYLILSVLCTSVHAMDKSCDITPEYFLAQVKSFPFYSYYHKGKELLNTCLPQELQAIWHYMIVHEKDLHDAHIWVRAMLEVMTKNGVQLLATVKKISTDKNFPLNKTAIDVIVEYFIREHQVEKFGTKQWQPLVPVDIALECLELLIAKGAVMDCDTIVPIIEDNNVALIKLLLRKGAIDSNGVSKSETPLLHLAQSEAMHNLLVEYGNTQIDSVDEKGLTILHRYAATSHRFGSIPEHLLKIGSRINTQDQNGNTPLHLAVQSKNSIAQKWLVLKGADCFVKNHAGEYALPIQLCKAYTKEIIQSNSTTQQT